MSSGLNNFYEFEDFRLDAATGTLWRRDTVVAISPKSAELLQLLLERNGGVVSKQEIFDSVWADTFVEEGVLTQNIYTLRHALGRDENGNQFIETVPRRGYRFAGQLKVSPSSAGFEVGDPVGPNPSAQALNNDELPAPILDESPRSFVAAVETIQGPRSISRPWTPLAIIAGVGLIAAIVVGIYKWMPQAADAHESKVAPIEQVRLQSLTDTGDIVYPTISPDGEMLAYVRLEGEQSTLWVKQIATETDLQILPASKKGHRSLVFSTDGRHIFYRDEADPGEIYQTSQLGGASKRVAGNVWSDFGISPDNTQLAFSRRDQQRNMQVLILMNLTNGVERVLGERGAVGGYRSPAPTFSPDGKRMVVAVSSTTQARPVLVNIDVETGVETELQTPNFREITRVLWTPDDQKLIIAARMQGEATSQVWTLRLADGELRRFTNDLEAYFWLSLSADGRTLVARQQRITSHIWLLPDGDIEKARQLTSGGRSLDGYVGLAWAPDQRIVFSSRSGNNTDLYSIDPAGEEKTLVSAQNGFETTWPDISSDGRYIIFVSAISGARSIWRMDRDGRNHKQLVFGDAPKESAYAGAIAPDGKEVFFIKVGPGPSAIWKTTIDGDNPKPVSNLVNATAESFLAVSPDGNRLAYQHISDNGRNRNEEGTIQIGVISADGSGEPMLFDVAARRSLFRWTSNDTFDYLAGTFNSSSLWRQPLDGEARKLIDFPDRVFNFVWSGNGKDLVVSRGRLLGDAVLITNLP